MTVEFDGTKIGDPKTGEFIVADDEIAFLWSPDRGYRLLFPRNIKMDSSFNWDELTEDVQNALMLMIGLYYKALDPVFKESTIMWVRSLQKEAEEALRNEGNT